MSYGPEEGNDHICPDCGAKWWDADGWCNCTKCRHCSKVGDEDFASDGYCTDCKDAEIERLNAALEQAVSEKESIKASNFEQFKIASSYRSRIRALEFQNAELRAKA